METVPHEVVIEEATTLLDYLNTPIMGVICMLLLLGYSLHSCFKAYQVQPRQSRVTHITKKVEKILEMYQQ